MIEHLIATLVIGCMLEIFSVKQKIWYLLTYPIVTLLPSIILLVVIIPSPIVIPILMLLKSIGCLGKSNITIVRK